MKVAFIDPRGNTQGLNTGLAYIASSLLQHEDVEKVKIFDFNNNIEDSESRMSSISGFDLVGVSVKTYTVTNALGILQRIRKDNGIVIAGGAHCACDGYNFLESNPEIDIVVPLEGEGVILDIVQWLLSETQLNSIHGIIYRQNGELMATPPRPREDDLGKLPFPEYGVFDSVNQHIDNYPLVTSRGCPYNCIYCSVSHTVGKRWRCRTVANVIDELTSARKKYGSRSFQILDDNFTLNMKRAKALCRTLIEGDVQWKWSCPNGIRADSVDAELLELMKEAGCTELMFGIETGDPRVFASMGKGESLEQINQAVQLARQIGIAVRASFIIGLPNSTKETFRRSLLLAKQLKLKGASWNILAPYPGTEAYEWMKTEARELHHWGEGFHFGSKPKPVFETDQLSAEEMVWEFYKGNIACRHYGAILPVDANVIARSGALIKLIAKYDIWNLPKHVFWIMRKCLRRLFHYVKRNLLRKT